MNVIISPVINHLFCHGTVSPRSCFRVQQQVFEYTGSYKTGISTESSCTKSRVPG